MAGFDRYGVLDLGKHYQIHALKPDDDPHPAAKALRKAFIAEFAVPHEPNPNIDAVCEKLSEILTRDPVNEQAV